jgi:hypothetical protein
VAREFPTDAEPNDGAMDAALRDVDPMSILEVAPEQIRCPDRLPIAEVARISIDDAVNDRVNHPECRRWASCARPICKPRQHLLILALFESRTPVIDTLA